VITKEWRELLALNRTDGTEAWRLEAIDTDPALDGATIVAGCREKGICGFDALTGEELWFIATDPIGSHGPIVSGDVVVAALASGGFLAVSIPAQQVLWTSAFETYPYDPPASDGARIYAFESSDEILRSTLRALSFTTGETIWQRDVNALGLAAPVVSEGFLYFADNDPDNNEDLIVAIEADSGADIWSTPFGEGYPSEFSADDDQLFIRDSDGTLHAFERTTGAEQWTLVSPTGTGSLASPAIADNVLYTDDGGVNIRAINAVTSDELWSYSVDAPIYDTPVVADGVLYFGALSGYFYAIASSWEDVSAEELLNRLATREIAPEAVPIGFRGPERSTLGPDAFGDLGPNAVGGVQFAFQIPRVPEELAQNVTVIVYETSDQAQAARDAGVIVEQRSGADVTTDSIKGSEVTLACSAYNGARCVAFLVIENALIRAESELQIENLDSARANTLDLTAFGMAVLSQAFQSA
jgi:outer membrane protein assembly factor BamB